VVRVCLGYNCKQATYIKKVPVYKMWHTVRNWARQLREPTHLNTMVSKVLSILCLNRGLCVLAQVGPFGAWSSVPRVVQPVTWTGSGQRGGQREAQHNKIDEYEKLMFESYQFKASSTEPSFKVRSATAAATV